MGFEVNLEESSIRFGWKDLRGQKINKKVCSEAKM